MYRVSNRKTGIPVSLLGGSWDLVSKVISALVGDPSY